MGDSTCSVHSVRRSKSLGDVDFINSCQDLQDKDSGLCSEQPSFISNDPNSNEQPYIQTKVISSKDKKSDRASSLKIQTIWRHYYPEGGWGWVVVTCAIFTQLLNQGLIMSYGMLGREVGPKFNFKFHHALSGKSRNLYQL